MKTVTARQFAVASTSTRGDQLCDELLLLKPLRRELLPTSRGDTQATIVHAIQVTDSGEGIDHGEFPVFWTVVQKQLLQATEDAPWIGGRLVKVGNAYRLDPLTDAEAALADQALAHVQVE